MVEKTGTSAGVGIEEVRERMKGLTGSFDLLYLGGTLRTPDRGRGSHWSPRS